MMDASNHPPAEVIDWRDISEKLAAPFDPEEVYFRPQTSKKGETANARAQALCYIDARLVVQRLDDVVPGAWSFAWEPIIIERGEVQLAKGRLTIHGVTREDIGEASTFSPSKGCISDALKRCAVQFKVAAYLYDVEKHWITLDGNGHIKPADESRLRELLTQDASSSGNKGTVSAAMRDAHETRETHEGHETRQPAASAASSRTAPAQSAHQPARSANGGNGGGKRGAPADESAATEQQMTAIAKLCKALGIGEPEESLTYAEAKTRLSNLSTRYNESRRQPAGSHA